MLTARQTEQEIVMAEIPENTVTMKDVEQWYTMQEQLSKLKIAESILRKRIVGHFFPTPREGVNSHPLEAGWVMKADCGIDRKVDEAALTTLKAPLKEAKISVDKLIRWKPELAVKEYRTLSDEQRHLFDQCLIIKPASPQLEIVLPKKAS
jgi:hypothetical protein